MEGNSLNFQVEPLSLVELGITAVASQIFNVHFPKISKQLQQDEILSMQCLTKRFHEPKDKCNNDNNLNKIHRFYDLEREIAKTVKLKLNNLPLNYATKTKILLRFLKLMETLTCWIPFIMGSLKLDKTYLDKIYWTSLGDVDVEKILLNSWINISIDSTYKGWFYKVFSPIDYLACIFAQENIVRKFQERIIRGIEYVFPWFNLNGNLFSIFRIISVIIYSYSCSDKEAKDMNEICPTAVEMLDICWSKNLHKAFIYFYNHLDGVEERNYLNKACTYRYVREKTGPYWEPEIKAPIIFFLLKKMNDSQRYNLIKNNFKFIFLSCIEKEHYQKFCIPLLDKYSFSLDNSQISCNFVSLFSRVVMIFDFRVLRFKLDYPFYIQILEILMKKIPKDKKIDMIFNKESNVLERTYWTRYVPVLKIIINNPDLRKYKIAMINCGKQGFGYLIASKKYEILQLYKSEILTSRTEEEAFDQIFLNKILKSWILDGRFDFVDNYLTWKYGDQAHLFKINLHPRWCSYVPKNYTKIKELLMWCFGKEEMPSVNNCKLDNEILSLKLFCQELIYNIWFRSNFILNRTHFVSAANLSKQILTSIFLSDVEIENFKKNELVKDESCGGFYCANSLKRPYFLEQKGETNFEAMDEFFKFCGLSEDKVAEIKRSVS